MGMHLESIFFENWTMQIIFNEILGAPTSIDIGISNTSTDSSNISSRFYYSIAYNWDAMILAQQIT